MHGLDAERELIKETERWLSKIEKFEIMPKNAQGKDFVKNINAYISDAKYFFSQHDYVRAFEAVIWAWAWLEIGERLELLNRSGSN